MKVFIPILCLLSLALAEPPVGDGYAAARSSHDDHHDHHGDARHDHHQSDNQRSLSQEYGPPSEDFSSSRSSSGYDYNTSNARSSKNARGHSQHAPAKVRTSFNQRFGSASTRNAHHSASNARSQGQGYPAPNTRSGTDEGYSSTQSQGYESARTLSTEYGVPNSKSSPSEEYGTPVAAARNNKHSAASNFRSSRLSRPSREHSAPASRSQDSQSHYTTPSTRSNNQFSSPKSFSNSPASRSTPSSSYGAPSTRSSSHAPTARNSNQHHHDSVSQGYDAHSQRDASENNAASSSRGLSQEYGVPSARSNLMTDAIPFPFSSARSSPASTYLPASQNDAPLEEYGVPEQRNAGQAYDEAKARALEELQNQEPANYDFAYQIEDQESGSDFGHSETREENRAQGSYFVVRPDGSKQTVEYEADERGFKPRISVEPAAAGYDENAQNFPRSTGGPY